MGIRNINFEGFSFFEKIMFRIKKNKLDFQEVKVFPNKNISIRTNIIFLGKHEGEITVEPNCYFIHRGELIGKLYISEKSKVIIFGKIQGEIISDDVIDLRSGSEVQGEITFEKIKIQHGVILNSTIKKKED